MLKPSRAYLPELDVVRFWAFFAVFVFHTVYFLPPGLSGSVFSWRVWQAGFAITQGGRFGVDLFFTLSAFLITSLLLAERESRGSISLRKFYIRRILRIWPLYFGMSLLVFGLAFLQHEKELLEFFWPYMLMAPNWIWALKGNPAVHTNAFLAIIVFWSLGIEEQFYLLWPLAMRKFHVGQVRTAAWFLIGISVIVRAISWSVDVPHPGIYANTFAHLDPIAVGILLACEWTSRGDGSKDTFWIRCLRSPAALALGILGFVLAGFLSILSGMNGTLFIFLGYPLIAWSGYLILFHTLLNLTPAHRSGRTFGALVYFGKISYGLYIFHAFIYDLTGPILVRLTGQPVGMRALHAGWMWTLVLISLGLTLLTAHLSYQYFERYFLNLKERFSMLPPHRPEAQKAPQAEGVV